jgi:hypothetical protein
LQRSIVIKNYRDDIGVAGGVRRFWQGKAEQNCRFKGLTVRTAPTSEGKVNINCDWAITPQGTKDAAPFPRPIEAANFPQA